MNPSPSIIIKTGGGSNRWRLGMTYPRTHTIDYENNPTKQYAMLHICTEKYSRMNDSRIIRVYYGNTKECLWDFICDFEKNISKELESEFYNFYGICIDKSVIKRNNNFFKLYKISDPKKETAKKMLERIKDKIRGNNEKYFKLDEDQIYRLDEMDQPLPAKFKVRYDTSMEDINKLFGY